MRKAKKVAKRAAKKAKKAAKKPAKKAKKARRVGGVSRAGRFGFATDFEYCKRHRIYYPLGEECPRCAAGG